MSSEWKSYADFDRFGTQVKVHLGQFYDNDEVLIASLGEMTFNTVTRDEAEGLLSDEASLTLRTDIAESLYLALDRIFGKHQSTEAADVLERALNYERSRVDGVLNALLRPTVVKEDPK